MAVKVNDYDVGKQAVDENCELQGFVKLWETKPEGCFPHFS
jgi:hypothetical protein